MTLYIGISGKLGSGKDYLSTQIMQGLTKKGYTVRSRSFADGLKEEAGDMLTFLRTNPTPTLSLFAEQFNMSETEASLIFGHLQKEVATNTDTGGYSRTPEIRTILQLLGTDIRRKTNPNYWIDKLFETVDNDPNPVDVVAIPDARFANEMDSVIARNGLAIRIDVPEEILTQRRLSRDGIVPSEAQLSHLSETALDDYKNFSIRLGAEYETATVVALLTQHLNAQRKQ